MISVRSAILILLVNVFGFFPFLLSAVTLVDMDAILVRQNEHDLLLCRPWVSGSTPGYLLWGLPQDATVKIQPPSKTNLDHLATLCEKETYAPRKPVPCQIQSTYRSQGDLRAGCELAKISLTQLDLDLAEEYFRSHQKVILIQWPQDPPGPYGRTWDIDRIPLMACTIERPTFWQGLPVHWPGSRRGCLGSFVMIANHPLAPGISPEAPMVIASLRRCDDNVSLHPVPLDLTRDLTGPSGKIAAAWASLHPSAAYASDLREILADTSVAGDNTAFAIWAWGQQNTPDKAMVLAPWLRHSDGLCWSEAWEAMRIKSDTGFDLHLLAMVKPGWHESQSQRSIDLSGWRVFKAASAKDSLVLRQIANQNGGWNEWATQRAHSFFAHSLPPLRSNQLTAGQWAVLTLARLGDEQARQDLTRALISSAAVNLLEGSFSRQSSHYQTLRRWNIHLILKPHDLSRGWPTLYQFCLATACQPGFRDQFLSQVVDDNALPGEAVSVVLSRISHWSSQDRENAWITSLTYPMSTSPFTTKDMMTRLRWKLTTAGMAYAMAFRFSDRQNLEFMNDCQDNELRAELITSLARWGSEDIAAPVEEMILHTWQPILAAVTALPRPAQVPRSPYHFHDLMRYIPEHQVRIIGDYLATSNPGREVRDHLKSRTDLCPLLMAFLAGCGDKQANPHTYPREGFRKITYP